MIGNKKVEQMKTYIKYYPEPDKLDHCQMVIREKL